MPTGRKPTFETVARLADSDARERIAEIGEILALGLVRLTARKSSQVSATAGESSLACVADQSGHANSEPGEMG